MKKELISQLCFQLFYEKHLCSGLLAVTFFLLIGIPASQAQLTVTLQTQPPFCGGFATGIVTAIPSGGTLPYSYLWNTGATVNPLVNVPVGTYAVTVTSATGATATASTTMTAPPPLSGILTVNTCSLPGSMTANVTGGIPPHTFLWSNGSSSQTISNLSPDIYCVTIMDANNCGFISCQYIGPIMSATVNTTNMMCGTPNGGTATAVPVGGVFPFTYLWSNGGTTKTIQNLAPGPYKVTVTSYNGCSTTATGTVGITPGNFNITFTKSHPTCAGSSTGGITASASGGTSPYTFTWSNGQTGQTISGLPAGTYTVTVTDVSGCTSSKSTTLAYQSNISLTTTKVNPVCSNSGNGSVTVNPSGGLLPWSYAWSNGATSKTIGNLGPGTYTVTVTDDINCTSTASATLTAPPAFTVSLTPANVSHCGEENGSVTTTTGGSGTAPFVYIWNNGSSSSALNNVGADTYMVTVTSSEGCTATGSATVTQPLLLNVSLTGTSLICGNATNGTLTASVTYGNPPYTFAWSNGGSSQTLSNLPAGAYSVTVTSSEGCSGTASKTIAGNPVINLQVNPAHVKCAGNSTGSAQAVANGGTPPLSYIWSTGATSSQVNNLAADSYSVTVTDGAGCTKTETVTITQPELLAVTISNTGACNNNGSANAAVTGGVTPYGYLWSTGATTPSILNLASGTYSLTVTDANGCISTKSTTITGSSSINIAMTAVPVSCNGAMNGTVTATPSGGTSPFSWLWNTNATTNQITGLGPGVYTVTVTDAAGCQATNSTTVTEPEALDVMLASSNGTCGGSGSIFSMVSGGTPGYTYIWSNGATAHSITGLSSGTFTVTVTDVNGCTKTGSATVQTLPDLTCNIQLTQPITTPGGSNGMLTASVTGGTAPFTFLWSNGQTTAAATGLGPGTYTVTVTDANNCETICDFTLHDMAKLGDLVWNDADKNGIQDNGEAGIEGVTVTVTGTTIYGDSFTQTITTGTNGMYMFQLQAGTYKVTFDSPSGFNRSPANQGNNDAIDSDMNIVTGMTSNYILAGGDVNMTVDAGFFPSSSCDNITAPGTICCDQTLCGPGQDPAPITQTAPPAGGTGNLEFIWMFSLTPGPFNPNIWEPITGATGPDYDPGSLSQTTYFIRCVRRQGCVEFLESNIVTVTVNTVAVAKINGPAATCINIPADFSAYNNGPGATYSWTFSGGAVPPAANTQNVNGVVWSSFGVKTVMLTVTSNGCTSTDIMLVNVSNSPTYCGNQFLITGEAIGKTSVLIEWFYSKTDSVQRNFQVEWSWGNQDFAAVTTSDSILEVDDFLHYKSIHHAAKRGKNFYRVKLEDSNNSVLYSNEVEVELVGDHSLVHIYPNPFNDIIKVEVIDRFDSTIRLELYSSDGKMLNYFHAPEEDSKMEIDTDSLPAGFYFVLIKYGNLPQKIYKMVKWK